MKPIIAIFLAFGVQANLYSQNLVDVTVGGSYAFTNTSNVISTNFGGTGQGIGWSANLYSDTEMGDSNLLLSLRWMIDYAATTAGDSYTMTDVSIWLFEYGANTVFPSTAIPDLAANGAVPVFQGDLVFTPPAQSVPNHCEADVQFSIPFQYNSGNALVVYIEKLTPYVGGAVSPYYGYMPGASGLRVLSNWSGTPATPLLPNANNGQQDRYALIKFNETDPADLCTQIPCDPGTVSGQTTLCPGTNQATINISNPNNGNVQWQQLVNSVWEDIPGENANSLTLENLTETSEFQALISNSSCATATSATITLTVTPVISPPELGGVTQPLCPANTGSVSFVNLPTPGNWTIIGNPSGSLSGSGASGTLNNLSPNDYTFSISWNGCTSDFNTNITTIETPQTAIPITTASTFSACISDQFTVNDLPVSFTGTPTILFESAPSFIAVNPTDILESGNYFVSQIDDTNECSPSDTTIISVYIEASQIPEVANNNFVICDSEALTVGDLGITGNGGTLNYHFDNGSVISAVNETDELQTGTYFATQTGPDNTCESIDSLEVTVTIGTISAPTTPANNQVFCEADVAVVGNLDIAESTNMLNYYYDNETSIDPVASTALLLAGDYYITATNSNTNCTSFDSLFISVTIVATPPPTTNSPNQSFCATDNPILSDLEVSGENIQWYDYLGTPLIASSPLEDNTSYFATQTLTSNGCESSNNLDIEVSITETPAPLSGSAVQYFCETENATLANITITGIDIQWYDAEINGTLLPTNYGLVDGGTYYASQIINGCESTSLLAITSFIQNEIDGSFTASETLGCSPFYVQLTPNFNALNANYYWLVDGVVVSNNATLDYTFTTIGCYDIQLNIEDENICSSQTENTAFICVSPSPIASFFTNPNILTINNQLVQFQNTSSNADSFIWDFGDGTTSTQINPEVNINVINETQTITLTAIAENGCENSVSLTLDMPENDVYVPNSFTPDADEHNQSWGPVFLSGFDKFNFQVLVFNRWGEIVWESFDADGRWDGKYSKKQLTCPEGIYTWKITYKKKNSDKKIVRTGHITLIR